MTFALDLVGTAISGDTCFEIPADVSATTTDNEDFKIKKRGNIFEVYILEYESLKKRISAFSFLKIGWDGFKAPIPNDLAIKNATNFLLVSKKENCLPNHVDPSVSGGIGFSFLSKTSTKEAYIEFQNSGEVECVIMEGRKATDHLEVIVESADFQKIIGQIKQHVENTPS